MPKAFVIGHNTIKDQKNYKIYADQVPKTIEKFGGKFLSRGGEMLILDGEPPNKRNVLIEFPNMETAMAWYNSDDYQKIVSIRTMNAEGYLIIAEGV